MDEDPKESYVTEIVALLDKCFDVALLDFILQLLQKASCR